MDLEKLTCPKCAGADLQKDQVHNLTNLLAGGIICAGISILYSTPLPLLASPVFYFTDTPFPAKEKYSCKQCKYAWQVS